MHLGPQLAARDDDDYRVWAQLGVTHICADPPGNPHHWTTADLERLRSLCAELPSVRLHIHDRAAGDDLTPERLAATATDGQRAEVWFCGPRGFGAQPQAGLARPGGRRLSFRRAAGGRG